MIVVFYKSDLTKYLSGSIEFKQFNKKKDQITLKKMPFELQFRQQDWKRIQPWWLGGRVVD